MKGKIIFTFFIWLALFSELMAQVDYNKIILPESATNISFEEHLVQVAWKNNPASAMAKKEVTIANYQYKDAKTKWTSLLGVNGNLNEFTIKRFTNANPDTQTGNIYFPRYNVYLHLPLSTFLELPRNKKIAKETLLMTEEKLNLYKLELRAQVLKLYSEFKKNEVIWGIHKSALADEESNFLIVEQRFKNGSVTVEEYIKAQKIRNDQKVQTIIAESAYTKAKLDLEEIIGIRLEEIR